MKMKGRRTLVAFEVHHSVFDIRYSLLRSAVEQMSYAE
jgi:hypothetical protein